MAITIDTLLLDSVFTPSLQDAPVKPVAKAPIDQFIEDPENPRFEYKDDPDFDASIKEYGILQPLVVRYDNLIDKFIIRFGSRRYRAALRVGLEEAPYIITEDPRQFDDYAQVDVNEQRAGLTPLEMAVFIMKKKNKGEKLKAIAKRLKKDPGSMTHYLSLIDMPKFILELYESHKCRSPAFLYKLRKMYELNADCVTMLCNQHSEITKTTVELITNEVGYREQSAKNKKNKAKKKEQLPIPFQFSDTVEKIINAPTEETKEDIDEEDKPHMIELEKPVMIKLEPKYINALVNDVQKTIDKLGPRQPKVIDHPNGSKWTITADAVLVGSYNARIIEIFTFVTTDKPENLLACDLGKTKAYEVPANKVILIGIFSPPLKKVTQ